MRHSGHEFLFLSVIFIIQDTEREHQKNLYKHCNNKYNKLEILWECVEITFYFRKFNNIIIKCCFDYTY